MSETQGLLLRLRWLRRLNQSLHRYDWDAKLTVDTNMTATPWPKLAQILLRHPKKIVSSLFDSTHLRLRVCDTLKNNDTNCFGCLSHICASLGQGVSVISVSMVSLVSHSYHCKLGIKRLNHISFIGTPRVSLISVLFRSFWRNHIRHLPLLFESYMFGWLWLHSLY